MKGMQGLTCCRAMGRLGQWDWMRQREWIDSLSAEPLAGWVSRIEWNRGNELTHFLQSRGQTGSAGLKGMEGMQQLTSCRAMGRLSHWDWMGQRECSDSQTAEPWVGWVSRIEREWDRENAATHFLQSHGQAESAGSNETEGIQQLTPCRAMDGLVSGIERDGGNAVTN